MTYQISSPGPVFPDLVLTTSVINTTNTNESSFQEDFFLPSDDPLDAEICKNVSNKIINTLCELNPEKAKKIDKTAIYNRLKPCVNEELDSRLLISDSEKGIFYGLRDLLIAAGDAENDSLECFHFAGSSIVYKHADAIIETLESSDETKDIVTEPFISNLKRKPHDSDWKLVIKESTDPSVSFWDNVECHVRAILRDVSKVKRGKILGDSFDIIAECTDLDIEYEFSFGKYFRLCFREHGIELAIGCFHGKLFNDTFQEIIVQKKSVTKDPKTLQVELSEDGVDIIQAGIFRGYNVISTYKPETKNDRAGIQYIRRSLNRGTCFSEIDYPIFIKTLFESYPISSKWAADIAKKFSNINKGHSNDPIDNIVWGLFIFLCSLKHFPEYKVGLSEEQTIWKALPFQCNHKEKDKNKHVLFQQHPFYQFMKNSQLPCAVVEGVFGIAGLLTLSLVEKGTKTAYSIGRHNGEKKRVLYFEHNSLYIAIEPDLFTFCASLKERYADVWGYHASKHTEGLLKLFLDSVNIPSLTKGTNCVIKNHARFLPQTTSDTIEIAYIFLHAPDPFLNVIGASVLMTARVYQPEAVDSILICYALPLLLSSKNNGIQAFGEVLAKRFFLDFQLKETPSFMHPKAGIFSFPHWLNAIALTGSPRCCQIASEHWVANVPLEKTYFPAYFTFMENLWRIEPLCLIKIWNALIPHAFDGTQSIKLFSTYAERILQSPESSPALLALEPFVFFTNTCLDHISTQEDKDKLFQLVGKIASLQPHLLPHCLAWLHLLPIDALPTLQLGTISAILHQKIHEARTYAEKKAAYDFLIRNFRVAGAFELFFNNKFIAFFKAMDLLDDVYEKYIREPSISPRQKVHISIKLFSDNPIKALSLETEITEVVESLIEQKILPYALLLKVFGQCLKCGPKHFFLLKQLCKFSERLLNDKVHPLTPVAGIFNKIDLTPAFTQIFLLFRLLERIVFEHKKSSFNTALSLVKKIRELATIPTSNWENLVHAIKLAAHHIHTKESYEHARNLASSLKLENAFHQADLDLLTFTVSQKLDVSLDNLLVTIASKKYLDKSQISQLKNTLQLHLDNILTKEPANALSLIKHEDFSKLFDQTELFQHACAVFIRPNCFDEELFKMILFQLDTVKEPSEGIIAFSNYLLQSEYLYYQCLDLRQKTERLMSLVHLYKNFSMQFWDNAALKLMKELISKGEYSLCMDLLEKYSSADQNVIELITLLIQKKPQSHYLASRIFKIALKIGLQLPIHTWEALGVAALEMNDSNLKKDLIQGWKNYLCSHNIQELINRSDAEKTIHSQMLLFSIIESSPLTIYFENTDLIPHLLSCTPKTSQKSLILSHFLDHLIVNSPNQMVLIEQGINDLIQWEGCLHLSVKILCQWVEASDAQNSIVDTYFQKIIEHKDINTTFIYYKWLTAKETKIISNCITKLLERQDKPVNLFSFIYFICSAFAQDNIIWLNILKGVVNFYVNDYIHYQTLTPEMVSMLSGFLALFKENPPEKLLSEYAQYFQSQAFLIFLLNAEILPQVILQGFLHCCHKRRLIPERTIAECAYLLASQELDYCLEEPVENLCVTNFEKAFLFYAENVILFINFPEFDDLCLDKYIQLISKLIQEKVETDNFQTYIDTLLAKRHPRIDNTTWTNMKGLVKTQIKLVGMLLNHIVNLNNQYYYFLVNAISELITSCVSYLEKETDTEVFRHLVRENIVKFILFPRSQDSALTHKFFSIAYIILLQTSASRWYKADINFEALKLYVGILEKNRKEPPTPEYIKIISELTLSHTPCNYFAFVEDLLVFYKSNHTFQEKKDKVSICETLLIIASKPNIPLPLQYVLLRNIWEIVYINGLLHFEKYTDETHKMRAIGLGFSLVERLTEAARHLHPMAADQVQNEMKLFFEGYRFALKLSYFYDFFNTKTSLTFNSTFFHTYFVSNLLRTIDEQNYLKIWNRYFALMQNFIHSIPDDLDHYMEVETSNLELLPVACNLTESSPWSRFESEIIEQRKILAVQTYELRLQCYVAKTFPIQELRSSFLEKSAAIDNILLFYRQFNPKNYKHIVSLLCDLKNPHDDIQKAIHLVKIYSDEGDRSEKNRIAYYYALIHCYELAKALGPLFRAPFESLLDVIKASIQEELKANNWFSAYQLMYKALKINIVPLDKDWQQLQHRLLNVILKQAIRVPQERNLEIIQRYFPKLMEMYIRSKWLVGSIMKEEKNEIIHQSLITVYQADIPSFDISQRGKTIAAYLKSQWEQGQFERQEWLISLLKRELSFEENVNLWVMAAEKAFKNPLTLNYAIHFATSLAQVNHVAPHKDLIESIVKNFLLQTTIPPSQAEECLDELIEHKVIPCLSENGILLSSALRKFLLNHFSIYQQNQPKCAALLNYYISSLIDLFFSEQCSNKFLHLQMFIDTLQMLALKDSKKIAIDCAKSFIYNIQQQNSYIQKQANISKFEKQKNSDLAVQLIIELYSLCQSYPNLKNIPFINDADFLKHIWLYYKTTSTLQYPCQALISLYPLYSWEDPETKKMVLSLCLEMSSSLCADGQLDDALKLFTIYQPTLKSIPHCDWERKWTVDLALIFSFFKEKSAWESAYTVFSILSCRSTYLDQNEKLKFYSSISSTGNIAMASKIAFEHDLLQLIDADVLLKGLFASPPTEENFQLIIQLYDQKNIKDIEPLTRYSLSLTLSKNNLYSLVSYLDKLENEVDLPSPAIRKQAWSYALFALYKNNLGYSIQCFNNIDKLNALLNEIPDVQEKERFNALLTLATLKAAPFPNQMSLIGQLWRKLNHHTQHSKLVSEVYEQLQAFVKTLDNQVHLCQCLELLSRFLHKNPSTTQSLLIIEAISSYVETFSKANLGDSRKQSLENIEQHFGQLIKRLKLEKKLPIYEKLLNSKISSFTEFAILDLELYLQKKLVDKSKHKELEDKLILVAFALPNYIKPKKLEISLKKAFDILVKTENLNILSQDKIYCCWNNLFIKVFDRLPASSFTTYFPIFCKLLKDHHKKAIPHIILFQKLLKKICKSFALNVSQNEKSRVYLPEFIKTIINEFNKLSYKNDKLDPVKTPNIKILSLGHSAWHLIALSTISKKASEMDFKTIENKKKLIQTVIKSFISYPLVTFNDSKSYGNNAITMVNIKTNLTLKILLDIVFHWYEPSLSAFFNSELTPIVNGELAKTNFPDKDLYKLHLIIFSHHSIRSELLIKAEKDHKQHVQSAVVTLIGKWLDTKSLATIQHVFKFLTNYQNHSNLFERGTDQLNTLLETILKTIWESKTRFNYSKGSADLFYEFLLIFFPKDTTLDPKTDKLFFMKIVHVVNNLRNEIQINNFSELNSSPQMAYEELLNMLVMIISDLNLEKIYKPAEIKNIFAAYSNSLCKDLEIKKDLKGPINEAKKGYHALMKNMQRAAALGFQAVTELQEALNANIPSKEAIKNIKKTATLGLNNVIEIQTALKFDEPVKNTSLFIL